MMVIRFNIEVDEGSQSKLQSLFDVLQHFKTSDLEVSIPNIIVEDPTEKIITKSATKEDIYADVFGMWRDYDIDGNTLRELASQRTAK